MKARKAAIAVMTGLALAACSDSSTDPRAASTETADPTAAGPESSVTPPSPSPTWTDPARILGSHRGIRVVRTLPSADGGPTVWHVLEDGRLLVADDGALWLEDAVSGAAAPIDAPDADDAGSIFAADDDGRHLTWVTTAAEDLFHFPWRIYTLDLATGVAREVARHHDVGVDPVPAAPDGTQPRIHRGRVYYSAVQRLRRNGAVVPAVYSVPADGSDDARVEVAGAYGPEVLGNELVYAKSSFGFVRWTLSAQKLDRTRRTRVLASGPGRKQRLSGLAGDGDTLMWLEKTRGRCTLRFAFADGGTRDLPRGGCGKVWASYAVVADGIAVFSRDGRGGYRTHAYRLPDGPTYRLTAEPTWGETHTNGDIITWRPATGPQQGETLIGRLPRE